MEAATRALGEIEARQRFRTRLTDRLSAVRQLESLCTLLMWVLARQLVEVHEVSHPAEILSRRVRISMAKATEMLDDAATLSKMPGLLSMFEEGRVSPNQVLVLVTSRRMLSRIHLPISADSPALHVPCCP